MQSVLDLAFDLASGPRPLLLQTLVDAVGGHLGCALLLQALFQSAPRETGEFPISDAALSEMTGFDPGTVRRLRRRLRKLGLISTRTEGHPPVVLCRLEAAEIAKRAFKLDPREVNSMQPHEQKAFIAILNPRPPFYNPAFAEILGDIPTAVFLQVLLNHWTADPEVILTDEEIGEETALTPGECRRARRRLKQKGWISARRLEKGTFAYTIHRDAVAEDVFEHFRSREEVERCSPEASEG